MSTPTTQTTKPTKEQYYCGSGCGQLTLRWTKPMPENGWLGEVTIGAYVNKPIQVFAPQQLPDGCGTDWRFQAQDGSFLGHMYVSKRKSYIRFAKFRAADQFPLVTCSAPYIEPGDDRSGIDRVV